MFHYPFHPGDYLLDTAHLSPLHDLAYRRLMDLYYTSEAPIPLETQRVATRLRLDNQVVSEVLQEFFEQRETGWHQSRCDEEITAYHAMATRNRANGSLGGRPRKNPKKPTGNPLGTQNKPRGGPTGNRELETEPSLEKERGRKDWPTRIVSAYPRRDSPMDCMQMVADAIAAGEAAEEILQAVREVASLCNAAPGGADNQFVPKARTFFSEGQWRNPGVFSQRWDKKSTAQSKAAQRIPTGI